MNKVRLGQFLGASLLAILAGCATPESRIKSHPDLFASFPPDIQESVRQGKIARGYTPDMVFIALGDPTSKTMETSAGGDREIWSYMDDYTTTEQQTVNTSGMVRDSDGNTHYESRAPVTVSTEKVHEYERVRVEFEQGRVSAIRTSTR